MARIKVIMEDENGQDVTIKSYDLGTDFSSIDKIEESIHSISGDILTDVTQLVLNIEQDKFLKKVSTKLTENIG